MANRKTYFHSTSKKFKLGVDAIQAEELTNDGRLKTPAHTIEFNSGFFTTDDKREQTAIESLDEFTRGKIVVVTEEAQQDILRRRAEEIGGTGSRKKLGPDVTNLSDSELGFVEEEGNFEPIAPKK